MYNRYSPQRDGTYQRSRVPEPSAVRPARPRPPAPPKQEQHCAPPEQAPCPPPCPTPEPPCPPPPCPTPEPPCPCQGHHGEPRSATGFFRDLLPKNMDTGDLLLLLILLLLMQDGTDDAPSALLTIALFFLL